MSGRSLMTRRDYKEAKKMDRQDFEKFCQTIYMKGYEAGKKSVPVIGIDKVKEAISQTKGIGGKRLDAIMESIDAQFGGENDEVNHRLIS